MIFQSYWAMLTLNIYRKYINPSTKRRLNKSERATVLTAIRRSISGKLYGQGWMDLFFFVFEPSIV